MLPVNLRTFDLNLLKVFDVVMAERSLTRAAQQLALTQPAVSNAMRRLRETLGDDLLVRKGRTLEPTRKALALWPTVREALQRLQGSLAPQEFEPASAANTFVLAMADSTASELLPGLVRVLETQAPGVSVRVVPLTTRDPRRLLDDGLADLAIGHFPAVLADLTARAQAGEAASFLHQLLFSSDYVCVMRRGHPLAQGALTLDNYCNAAHMLVSFSGRAFGFVDEALASVGRKRRVVLTVNQFFTAGTIATESDLLAVLPRHLVHVAGHGDALITRELPLPVPPIQVDALWHQRLQSSPAHQWLHNQIAQLGTLVTAA
jgi:DNA-binding transcriptional LysR family regulator